MRTFLIRARKAGAGNATFDAATLAAGEGVLVSSALSYEEGKGQRKQSTSFGTLALVMVDAKEIAKDARRRGMIKMTGVAASAAKVRYSPY